MKNFIHEHKIDCSSISKIVLNSKNWQLLKLESHPVSIFIYIDKKTGIVFKFEFDRARSSDSAVLTVQDKNNVLCKYITPIHSLFLMPSKNKELLHHLVEVVHNSFYYTFPNNIRDDLIKYINIKNSIDSKDNPYITTETFRSLPQYSFNRFAFKAFDPLYISYPKCYIKAAFNQDHDNKFLCSDITPLYNKKIKELLSYYTIKNIEHHFSLSKEDHYYNVIFYKNDDNKWIDHSVKAVYNTLTNIATFTSTITSSTYKLIDDKWVKPDSIVEVKDIFIENNQDIQYNMIMNLTALHLKNYIRKDILQQFNNASIDLSDGITENNLLLLKMVTI